MSSSGISDTLEHEEWVIFWGDHYHVKDDTKSLTDIENAVKFESKGLAWQHLLNNVSSHFHERAQVGEYRILRERV